MADSTDAGLVLAAITAYAAPEGDSEPISALSLLAHVKNDSEALVIAVGYAAWLVRQSPDAADTLRRMALEVAKDDQA